MYHYQYCTIFGERKGNEYQISTDYMTNKACVFFLTTASQYEATTKEKLTLSSSEIVVFEKGKRMPDKLDLFGKKMTVKEHLKKSPIIMDDAYLLDNMYCIVVADNDVLTDYINEQEKMVPDSAMLYERYAFNTSLSDKEQIALTKKLKKVKDVLVDGKAVAKQEFISCYGCFLFLGIFLGILFSMATTLIIYYKQISEGYDDKDRFEIMQKVGMDKKEIKQSIRSQILLVFFLPLAVACIHTFAAFPIVKRLLAMFGFSNTKLFVLCILGTVLAFSVVYAIVYSLTSKVYYKIVSTND